MQTDIHVKYPLFLSDFNETWIFSTDFRKTLNIKFQKIHTVGASCSVRTNGRTDMTNLIVAFRNFTNAPKKLKISRRRHKAYWGVVVQLHSFLTSAIGVGELEFKSQHKFQLKLSWFHDDSCTLLRFSSLIQQKHTYVLETISKSVQ
jgi:hypothetical protein